MIQQQKLSGYKEDDTPEWIIGQLKRLGMTYTEMADRMSVNRSTLYRFRKGAHRSPKMKEKILKMFNKPYHGVAIFFIDSASPRLEGRVYNVVYNEKHLQRQINKDIERTGGTLVYFKFVKRFTSAMVAKHQSIGRELERKHIVDFPELDQWLIEQVSLMKTQKTKTKTLKLLSIDYKELT